MRWSIRVRQHGDSVRQLTKAVGDLLDLVRADRVEERNTLVGEGVLAFRDPVVIEPPQEARFRRALADDNLRREKCLGAKADFALYTVSDRRPIRRDNLGLPVPAVDDGSVNSELAQNNRRMRREEILPARVLLEMLNQPCYAVGLQADFTSSNRVMCPVRSACF